jgi:hypothetical protein
MRISISISYLFMSVVTANLALAQISPLQPNELEAINKQPLVPPQGVMGKPKPLPPETAPQGIIVGPNYQSDTRGEAEAKSLEDNSAQPMNPREGLITIPFN